MNLPKEKKPKYRLGKSGNFVIENYNFAKPFANFFPGVAGKYGIPMWTFYVNRAQAVTSFGTRDKDHSILEYFPANKSWQFISSLGFRTFIKISQGAKDAFYEPFHNGFTNLSFCLQNRMEIAPAKLVLEEENASLKLKVRVEYFNIPNDNYAGLARIIQLENYGPGIKKIQLLDGVPQIVPFGTSNLFLKKLGRTIEAWMKVENMENGVPFYRLAVDPIDRPEVVHINEGNFYLSFAAEGKIKIIKPIINPQSIFGPVTDFSLPTKFLEQNIFRALPKENISSRMACAFSPDNFVLGPGRTKTIYTIIGCMRNLHNLNSSLKRISSPEYLSDKSRENEGIIREITDNISTSSSCRNFDLYCRSTYLDNVLRGGYPVILGKGENKSVFYLYSRKHGDLERDYNKFSILPAYFSQGNGNYRDVNQNRRLDVWFNPEVEDDNLVCLLNLIQADGYNPLVIKGLSFLLKDKNSLSAYLKKIMSPADIEKLAYFLEKPFSPGEAILFLEDNRIKIRDTYDSFLNELVLRSEKIQEAEHAEGFWTDHWHYNLDLLESYLGIYPEKLKEMVFLKRKFTYFDNTEIVRPRKEKYILYNGSPRQLHALVSDNTKKELIRKRNFTPHLMRKDHGKGDIYETTLINKLLCLLANKYSSLDPFGTGIEMEADKPNWFDALNGLPAIFGSSSCETFELKRLIKFLLGAIIASDIKEISLTQEVWDLLKAQESLTLGYFENKDDYLFWDKASCLKEDYRHETKLGFSGKEMGINSDELMALLRLFLKKVELGLDRAKNSKNGDYCSYFINQVEQYEALKGNSIWPKKFKQLRLPMFLEAQMHALRLAESQKEAKKVFAATRESALFDRGLKMYKVTSSLKTMPEEIGRCRVFDPGWLENESIWLHMEYKYLLETLKAGLYDEFFTDFKNCLIAFQDPRRYGRNILENSSFLVSSAFNDKSLVGNGFVARLSGSTAEFLQIWLTMNCGQRPFFLDNEDRLNLSFKPALAGWLFGARGEYSFKFLSEITVTYHNPKRKNTFGKSAVTPRQISFVDQDNNPVTIPSGIIPAPYAVEIRQRKIKKIDILLE